MAEAQGGCCWLGGLPPEHRSYRLGVEPRPIPLTTLSASKGFSVQNPEATLDATQPQRYNQIVKIVLVGTILTKPTLYGGA